MTIAGNQDVTEVLFRLNVGATIDLDLLKRAFESVLKNNVAAPEIQMGALLTGLMARGPTDDEVCSLLESAFSLDGFNPRERGTVSLPRDRRLIGAMGSGKKGVKTMNISTPAMLTAAAAGAYTAKTVSTSTSSMTGSADFLRSVGFNLNGAVTDMVRTIETIGFGAFDIAHLIPTFDKAYSGRFFAPHALSFGLPALVSPIHYDDMLYGLAHPNVELAARVISRFGIRDVMVVSTTHDDIHYLDEMGIYGTTRIIGVRNGVLDRATQFQPTEQLGLPRYTPASIAEGGSVQQNVSLSVQVLAGKGEAAREDVVCINAATILYLSKLVENLREGYERTKHVIKLGLPLAKLFDAVIASGGTTATLEQYIR